MLLTSHTIIGSGIALTLQNPALIAPVAFASHYVADSMPHFGFKDPSRKKFVIIGAVDSLLSLVVFLSLISLFPDKKMYLLIGYIFAILPDMNLIMYALKGIKWPKMYWKYHSMIQWCERPWGILTEIATILVVSYYFIF